MNPAAISIDTLIAACVTIAVDVAVAIIVWAIQHRLKKAEKAKAEREAKADAERRDEQKKREREHRELMERMDAEDEGLRSLLRNELVRLHREWVEEKGYITLSAKEYALRTYEAYHTLGGNGTGTSLWKDIEALPVKEER